MVKEVYEEKSQRKYFVSLRDSINKYQRFVYNPTYEERLFTFTRRIPFGLYYGNGNVGHFTRIHCYLLTKSICVSWGNTLNELKNKVEEHVCSYRKVQNFHDKCYFYDDESCMHFWTTGYINYNYHLLHNSNENEHLKLTNGKKVMIDDISKHKIGNSIVLWLKK